MRKVIRAGFLGLGFILAASQIALADPLDDARAQMASFIQRAGFAVSGLAVGVASLAISVIAIRRKIDIATGTTDGIARHHKDIIDVLKLLAWVGASGLAAAIAGSIFR